MKQEERWLLDEKYEGMMSDAFLRDCERIAAGEPLDYVIGWKDFLGCRIDLSRRPLIPRVETEYWVECFIRNTKYQIQNTAHFLDMFSGSGCIGIAVLKQVPEAIVDFADIDESALEQIQINCKLNKIEPNRYRIIHSDIFSAPSQCGESDSPHISPHFLESNYYDYILANPPYVAEEGSRNRVQESVARYEPREALFGGPDGLGIIKKFLTQAPKFLKPGGVLFMEYDDNQRASIYQFVSQNTAYANWPVFRRDQYGVWRWMVLTKNPLFRKTVRHLA